MKLGHEAAAAALNGASRDLEEAAKGYAVGGSFAARFLDFGKALFANPLAKAALDAVIVERARPSGVLGGAWTQITQHASGLVTGVDQILLNLMTHIAPMPAAQPHLAEMQTRMQSSIEWKGSPTPVYKVLQQVAAINGMNLVTRDEGDLVRDRVIATLTWFVERLEEHGITAYFLPSFKRQVDSARRLLTIGLTQLEQLETMSREYTLAVVSTDMQAWYLDVEDVLLGNASLPLPESHTFARMKDVNFCLKVADAALLLEGFVRARLRSGPVQQHTLIRLCSYLEHFGREVLVERLAAKKYINREAVVQSEVDRFLFSEGIFPITHAVAGRGRIDTFVEEDAADLFAMGEAGEQVPFLLEIKQAITPPRKRLPGPKALSRWVKSAATLALDQADGYRRHLDAKPRWRGHEVYALVIYNGPTRFLGGDKPVRLVYVGEAPQSDPKQSLW